MSDTSAPIASQWAHIRSGNTETLKVAYKDLETALDLHSPFVQLTLLNLGFLDIKNQNYDKAIARIEAALLLSISPRELGAAYLRLCLPEYRLGFRDYWEQRPANVIDASYVNLGYALLKSNRHKEGARYSDGRIRIDAILPILKACACTLALI